MAFLIIIISTTLVFAYPVDRSADIKAEEFSAISDRISVSPVKKTSFPFTEAIYSWEIDIPEQQGMRLFVRFKFDEDNVSPWLYAGYWGEVQPRDEDIRTTSTYVKILYDHIFLKKPATAFQFRIKSEGEKELSVMPRLHFVYTREAETGEEKVIPEASSSKNILLDLPFRSQHSSTGEYIKSTCQSAALATAMEYFGKKIPLEDIASLTYDPEYDLRGVWPRTIAAATQYGFRGYIDRFRDWDDVRETVAQNRVILASITMPEDGDYIDPPYSSMGGHIVAVNGVTEDGRVVVTDSALSKNERGYRLQWLIPDFEQIWMKNKGGVGMVIYNPEDKDSRVIRDLKPFPSYKKDPSENKE